MRWVGTHLYDAAACSCQAASWSRCTRPLTPCVVSDPLTSQFLAAVERGAWNVVRAVLLCSLVFNQERVIKIEK